MFANLRSEIINYIVYVCVFIGAHMCIVIFGATLRSKNYVSLFSVYRNTAIQLCELDYFILSVH